MSIFCQHRLPRLRRRESSFWIRCVQDPLCPRLKPGRYAYGDWQNVIVSTMAAVAMLEVCYFPAAQHRRLTCACKLQQQSKCTVCEEPWHKMFPRRYPRFNAPFMFTQSLYLQHGGMWGFNDVTPAHESAQCKSRGDSIRIQIRCCGVQPAAERSSQITNAAEIWSNCDYTDRATRRQPPLRNADCRTVQWCPLLAVRTLSECGGPCRLPSLSTTRNVHRTRDG